MLFLLLGMHKPSSGRVTIDGRDVTSLSLTDRKRLFFFGRASTAFVQGTVADNIAIHRTLSRETWDRTLDRVKMDKRVAAEPEGVNTPMGDKGEPFSGGEQQRVAFARALLTDAPCLILDETLATLDEAIEDLIVIIADLEDLTRDLRYKVETVKREAPKVGRNDPCPCGSGKKYKQCHGKLA